MKNLLIASVYAKSELNPLWVKLQKEWISYNTNCEYDLSVFLNGVEDDKCLFNNHIIIGESHDGVVQNNLNSPDEFRQMSEHHYAGISKILKYFRENEYENYLLIDSDCFPIEKNWFDKLEKRIEKFSAAAIVRFENLDFFPHPSAFFIKREALFEDWVDFQVHDKTNILQENIQDVGCKIPSDKVYPLIRTNYWNPHPIFAGIYGGLFYHHGCGSRISHFRSYPYYADELKFRMSPKEMLMELKSRPKTFIGKLTNRTPKLEMF